MKYIIAKTDPFKPYFNMQANDPQMFCRDIYTLFDISCIAISDMLFDSIYPIIPAGYEEVTEQEATLGSLFFSEVRDTVKVLDPDSKMHETVDMPGQKHEIPFTDEMKAYVKSFMYRFAKEIIETEYNYRFKNLRNTTELEQASWEIQKHEAREWLTYGGENGHVTPFLDYLAQEKSLDKTELSNKILSKAEAWSDKLSTMLVDYQKLINQFEDAETIWDMNILYEKYFGIMVPAYQSKEMGLQDENGRRIFEEDGVTYYDINNPRYGNKLNF